MTEYNKTRWMNILGAVGLALLGIALFFNKVGEQPTGILITIILVYSVLTAVPVFSARALSQTFSCRRRTIVIAANWFFIGLWAISFLFSLYTHMGILQSVGSIFMFVLPQAINIRALRKLNQQSIPSTSFNQTHMSVKQGLESAMSVQTIPQDKEEPDESSIAQSRLEAIEAVLAEANLFAYELEQGLVPDGNSENNPGYGPMDFDEWLDWKQREFERTGNLWHNHPGGLPPQEDNAA